MSPRIKRTASHPLALLALLTLQGCGSVGPDYAPPEPPDRSPFLESGDTSDTPGTKLASDWWKLFNDPELDRVQSLAAERNPGLRAAFAALERARALSDAAQAGFWPTVDGSANARRSRASGTMSNTVNAGGDTRNTFGGSLSLSYEADVWGRVRRLVESADANAKASEADIGVVLRRVHTELAVNYFNLRGLDTQASVIGRNLDLFSRQVEVTRLQVDAGLAPKTDLLQAMTLLESTRTQLIETRRRRANLAHAIAELAGLPPSKLALKSEPLPPQPPLVPAGMPADMLSQRPDVAAAELRLIAANAEVGVAHAEYYPRFTLTGTGGFQSIDTAKITDWESRFWSLAPSVSVPLLRGGALDAGLARARANHREALENFRAAVLGAIREVEDALNDLRCDAEAACAQELTLKAARENARLAELGYRKGITHYLQVIDANRTLISNELLAAQILNRRLVSTVQLIGSLGAGWSKDAAPPQRKD